LSSTKRQSEQDDTGPHVVAWRYDRGGFAIMIEGLDQYCDGQVLWSFCPEVGFQIGEPTILALSGEPSLLLFKGDFEGHHEFFRTWDKLAEENN
jgi:hypothetical protein